MFVKEHCSPRKDEIKDSCLKKKTLLSIAKILNKKNNTKIKLKKTYFFVQPVCLHWDLCYK